MLISINLSLCVYVCVCAYFSFLFLTPSCWRVCGLTLTVIYLILGEITNVKYGFFFIIVLMFIEIKKRYNEQMR